METILATSRMRRKVWLGAVLCLAGCSLSRADQASLTCPLRQIGLDFAVSLQPWRPLAAFQAIADALNGAPESSNCSVTPWLSAGFQRSGDSPHHATSNRAGLLPLPQWPDAEGGVVVFVDPSPFRGSDETGDGSEQSPFLSLRRALAAVRQARAAAGIRDARQAPQTTLVLRRGTFYLGSEEQGGGPLQLGPGDSRITFAAESPPDEAGQPAVFISGGVPLTGVAWQHTPAAAPLRPAYEYRPGSLAEGFDVAPAGSYTLEAAQRLCSSISSCAALGYTGPPNASGVIDGMVFRSEALWSAAPATGSVYVKNVSPSPDDLGS